MIVHVLAYLTRTLRVGPADWRRHAEQVVAGARSRRAALGGALLAGAIVALATYPAQQAWLSHRRGHRDTDGGGRIPGATMRRIAPIIANTRRFVVVRSRTHELPRSRSFRWSDPGLRKLATAR
jgi:hypothetical protein